MFINTAVVPCTYLNQDKQNAFHHKLVLYKSPSADEKQRTYKWPFKPHEDLHWPHWFTWMILPTDIISPLWIYKWDRKALISIFNEELHDQIKNHKDIQRWKLDITPLQKKKKKVKGCHFNYICVALDCDLGWSVGEGVGTEAVIPASDLCFRLFTKWHIQFIYRV